MFVFGLGDEGGCRHACQNGGMLCDVILVCLGGGGAIVLFCIQWQDGLVVGDRRPGAVQRADDGSKGAAGDLEFFSGQKLGGSVEGSRRNLQNFRWDCISHGVMTDRRFWLASEEEDRRSWFGQRRTSIG